MDCCGGGGGGEGKWYVGPLSHIIFLRLCDQRMLFYEHSDMNRNSLLRSVGLNTLVFTPENHLLLRRLLTVI